MGKNKFKQKNMAMPIENHETAPWTNIAGLRPVSRIPIPSELEVENAKEYVEINQK